MKLRFILLIITSVFARFCFANERPDNLLSILKTEIHKKRSYDNLKERQLKTLKYKLTLLSRSNINERYALYDTLVDAYKSYNFDSAHVYTYKLIAASSLLRDRQKQFESKIKLGTLQLGWGMYKEAFECIEQLNPKMLTDSNKLQYYALKARALYELSAYNTNRFYSPTNLRESLLTLDTAINFCSPGTYEKSKYLGQYLVINGQKEKAIDLLEKLYRNRNLSFHERAMVANDLSYLVAGNEEQRLLIMAMIYDIRTSTKATLAAFRLGALLVEHGDLYDAEWVLNEALDEGRFFGNELQVKSIETILTRVAAQKLIQSANEKNKVLIILISLVSVSLIAIAFGFYSVFVSRKKIQIREVTVQEKYRHLDNINRRLLEEAYIKEEYIGYFFDLISGYILKLEKLKRNAEHKLKIKNYESLLRSVNEINIKDERKQLFHTFDTIFLRLFPNFIHSFNALLKPEDQIWPANDEILNTNLRIFALMRLGIKNPQKVANILQTTVGTVYTYRNRIRAKALVHGEEFDNKIMEIQLVDTDVAANQFAKVKKTDEILLDLNKTALMNRS